jgi:predicted NUDIX family phosphoesterase
MDKFEKEVLVVPRAKLFSGDEFTGFKALKNTEYLGRIKNSFEFMKRGPAEKDSSYKQIIPYAVIANKKQGTAYFYRRGSGAGYSETRLYSKGSIGVGGHLEKEDCAENEPIEAGMLREISEEITINGTFRAIPFGFINMENTEVSQVHFGVVYIIETDATEVRFNNGEIVEGGMIPPSEMSAENVEEWTEMLIGPVKEYLDKKN